MVNTMKKQNNNWHVFFTTDVIMMFAQLTGMTIPEAKHYLFIYLPTKVSYEMFVATFMRWKTLEESQQVALSIDLVEHDAGDFMAIMDVTSNKFLKGEYLK